MRDTLLIDTHVLLWVDVAPGRLSRTARVAMERQEHRVLVSAISVFELGIKHRLGRLPEAGRLLEALDASLARYGFQQIDFTTPQARSAGWLELDHRDPFDRALVAQALDLGVPLVTADPRLRSFAGVETIW